MGTITQLFGTTVATYNTVAPTPANGATVPIQSDAHGNMHVNNNTLIHGEDEVNDVMKVEGQFHILGANISTNTTTVSKNSPGYLRRLLICNPGMGETITLYDNTSAAGVIIGIFNPTQIGFIDFDLTLALGLTIVTAGTTPANVTPIGR